MGQAWLAREGELVFTRAGLATAFFTSWRPVLLDWSTIPKSEKSMQKILHAASWITVLALNGCASAPRQESRNVNTAASSEPRANNPLLVNWSGPFGGVPGFEGVRVDHFKPALEAAMAEDRREIDAIAQSSEPADFDNTSAAFENAGRSLRRVQTIYGVWESTLNGPEFQAVDREMAPVLAAFSDEIVQNEKLFARIQAVYESPDKTKWTAEQQRLVWRQYTDLVLAGAKLGAEDKQRMAEINKRLASLYTAFSQNVLSDEETYAVILDAEADLEGLPDSLRAGAAAAAERRKLPGKWAITNTRSSVEPFLTFSARRDLREKVWKNFVNRGDNGDAHDNNQIISDILLLRAERARLLGYPTHAHWRLQDSMAKTPEATLQLMEAVWTPALARVREEVANMQAIANRESKQKIAIAPWDYRYYAEKVRKATYDLDTNEIKPYLQLDKLREGLFWVAGELFDLTFSPVTGVPVYHPDVSVWEVKNKRSGQHVGLWYFDPYAREGKQSGAWMSSYRDQERFRGEVATIVSNNANFVKPRAGEATLVSWDDATTLFHEFGHALHGLSSNVNYPSLSGTSVPRDYVEFPSQLLEHWLSTPEVLSRFALHFETGEPIPKQLVEKIDRASRFNEGFITVEYLATALIDMKLHLAGEKRIDPDAFERETLQELHMPAEIVMRHRTPQLSHVFAGDGYSAGYYSYLWADTLTADAYEAFTEAGGPYDKAVAGRLLKNVFQAGNTVDPAQAYRAFRGKDPGIAALMRKRGFPVPAPAKN
jgi:peptidyl-dipeptidase Dcp